MAASHSAPALGRMLRRPQRLSLALAVGLFSAFAALGAVPAENPEAEAIPYASLEEAMSALRAQPSVTFRHEGAWTIAEDKRAAVVWLLTPVGHPAYPSIVRRSIVNSAQGAHMQTDVRCFASQSVCDKYFGGE